MTGVPRLELRALNKRFGETLAVGGVDLSVARGEFVSLLGPSGCGKSTLLSLITGLVEPDSGEVVVDGRVVNHVAPRLRRLGLVFQDYAVFGPLTVRQNLAFGLEAQGIERPERLARVHAMAGKLGLEDLLDKRGALLNMSEMQRVALGRVLVTQPELLLLDEPMSNLDAGLRLTLRTELKRIQAELKQTVLYVTHDQSEAMAMSDRIAVMRAGRIVQLGTPEAIYNRPATRFVAEFIGDPPMNIMPCVVTKNADGIAAATTALHGPLLLPGLDAGPGPHLLAIRPHDVVVTDRGAPQSAAADVRFVENLGAEHVAYLDYGGQLVAVAVRPHAAREGQPLAIAFPPSAVHLIRESDGVVIGAPDLRLAA